MKLFLVLKLVVFLLIFSNFPISVAMAASPTMDTVINHGITSSLSTLNQKTQEV